jgi:hypothetical protein
MQHDAVLMEVGVGAVLQIELLTRQRDGHNAVGLARREVDAARVANVLLAEHAGGVAGFGLQALEGKYFLSFFDNFVKSDGNICTAPQNGVS